MTVRLFCGRVETNHDAAAKCGFLEYIIPPSHYCKGKGSLMLCTIKCDLYLLISILLEQKIPPSWLSSADRSQV
jgi:hypothetical protein